MTETRYSDYWFGKVAAHSCTDEWKQLMHGTGILLKESAKKKDEYKGPKAREVAGTAAGAGAGLGAGAMVGELGKERTRSQLRALEKQRQRLTTGFKDVGKGLGTPGTAERLKRIETLQKSVKGTAGMLGKRLKGKWKLPAAGAALGAGVAGGAIAAGRPEVKETAKKLYEKSKKYI